MRFLLLGILIGSLIGLAPVLKPQGGIEILPEWYGKINFINEIEASNNTINKHITLTPLEYQKNIFILSGNGILKDQLSLDDELISITGNGKYYVKYKKVGQEIEFFNIKGERFWKIKSMEYPYISYNGKIILLLNGDHSRIRLLDYNGNIIDKSEISGRFCTIITFSKNTDFAAAGFLDGSYYAIDPGGSIYLSGRLADNSPVKGMAISPEGKFVAIHYNQKKKDYIKIINIQEQDENTVSLTNVHLTKTAINITDSGETSFIDFNKIVMADSDGDIIGSMSINPKRDGYAKIDYTEGLYSATYTAESGEAIFLLFTEKGAVLDKKEFPEESFLDCYAHKSLIFLRGSKNLLCYSFHH